MIDKEYKYELKYTNEEGSEVSYTFDGDVDVYALERHLKRFLLACSWLPVTLDNVFKGNEDD